MLRTRVITALWLGPLAFLLIFAAPSNVFQPVLAGVLLVGAWEFRRLADLRNPAAAAALPVIQALVFLGLMMVRGAWAERPGPVLAVICGAWLLMLLRLRGYDPDAPHGRGYRAISFISALVTLSGAWIALCWLQLGADGPWWILSLLLVIWAADTCAYFAGRALGKRKLAPGLSPGKTLEGFAGGLLAGAVVGGSAIALLPTSAGWDIRWFLLSLLVAVVSVGGDLFVSLHKRTSGHKDSGRIFPGHGGVLDRLDSLLAGAPFFALGHLLLGAS